jgi:hypothetical protein
MDSFHAVRLKTVMVQISLAVNSITETFASGVGDKDEMGTFYHIKVSRESRLGTKFN